MRKKTIGAVLYSVFSVDKISFALSSERIQRTITEKTVEIIFVRSLVAREIFTFFV